MCYDCKILTENVVKIFTENSLENALDSPLKDVASEPRYKIRPCVLSFWRMLGSNQNCLVCKGERVLGIIRLGGKQQYFLTPKRYGYVGEDRELYPK